MGRFTSLVLAIVLLTTFVAATEKGGKKCRALVLEGGGDMGSYQVGVLKAFVDNLPKEDLMYDVITGVSVGSINAMAIALHAIGDEKTAVNWMYEMWGQLTSSDIYTSWPLGMIQGLFFKEGLWDNASELTFLAGKFEAFKEKGIQRRVNIVTVDFDTGEMYRYTENTPVEDIPAAVVASTSMPFAFPHTYLDGHTFVDGGTVWNIDLSGAIERCGEVVKSHKDIIVDVILCNSAQNITRDEQKEYNTISNFQRYQQIRAYYATLSDFYEIVRGYPDVNFRYLLMPQEDLPSGFLPLGFDHDDMMAMIEIGIREGLKAIEHQGNQFMETLSKHLKRSAFYRKDSI